MSLIYGSKVAVISHEKNMPLEISSSGVINLKINFRPHDLNTTLQNIENIVVYKINEFVKKINKNNQKF